MRRTTGRIYAFEGSGGAAKLSSIARRVARRGWATLLVATGMIHAFAFFETLVPEDIERLYSVTADFYRSGKAPAVW